MKLSHNGHYGFMKMFDETDQVKELIETSRRISEDTRKLVEENRKLRAKLQNLLKELRNRKSK